MGGANVAAPLEVRRSAVSLVPPEPLMLGGYTERQGALFEPGGDDLMSRTLLLSQGGVKIAVCSLEMLTVPESLVREVRKRVPEDIRLFLTATHTHCAPDSQMLNDRMTFSIPGIATYKRRWLQWYADRIAEGIQHALQAKPATWGDLRSAQRNLPLNRVRRALGKADPTGTVLFADVSPVLVHYAAHPVNYEPSEKRLRSDWPGAAMRSLDVMALNGALGDVSPNAPGDTPAEKVRSFVDAFAALSKASKRTHLASGRSDLRWAEVPIRLGTPLPHPDFAKSNGVTEELAGVLVKRFAPEKASVAGISLGKLAIVGVPGEPTAELGRRMVDSGKRAGFSTVLVVSHVNGWMGYVLSREDYGRGGYEATLAFHGPGAGDDLVDAAARCLAQLARPRPAESP